LIPEIIEVGVLGGAGLMAWAVRGKSSTWLAPSVHRGPIDRKAVALTFDDGPSPSTADLLDYLESEKLRATFFQIGRNVERLPDVARRVAAAGHEIGNHTYSHAPFCFRHRQFIEDDVGLGQEAIETAAGVRPALFRAPYGARWFGLRQAQERFNLQGVMWTEIGRDWKLGGAAIARRILRGAANGAIFCLHDGRALAPRPDITPTLEAVRRIVPELRKKGFEFVTVSELLCSRTSNSASSR
jgi:peptidoglycan/xylan/chitin deacetylase (PgdA/CDA1 family)